MNANYLKKINNFAALICTLSAIIILASIISKFVWQLFDKNSTEPISKVLDSVAKAPSISALPFNLFGSLNTLDDVKLTKIENTRLNLVLVGILSKQENPSVIIIKEGGPEKIYKINDFITPSTVLKEVFSQYVVIERNGSLEKLEIKRSLIDSAKTSSLSNFQISEPKKMKLKGYLRDLKTNPEKLFDVLSVQPNFNNGELRGFIISPGSEKVLFEDLGFQKNDIILKINNRDLNNLSQAIKLRNVLAEKTIFDFIIERNGQTKYLSINLN